MEVYELREKLLDEAMDYLEEKHDTQKKFAKLHMEYIIKQGIKVDNYQQFVPPMYSVEEAVTLAKQMETYITGSIAK